MTDSAAAAFDPRALANRLHGLRSTGAQAPTADFSLPGDLRHAMDAQNFLAADESITSNAWKVAVSPDGQAVTAPLQPYHEAVSGARIPWRKGMKFEAEIAVRLGKDLPLRDAAYSRAEIVEAVADAYLGAELLVSGIKESGSLSFLLFLADRLGNSGYVLGPVLPNTILDTVGGAPLKVTLNGQGIYDAPAGHPKGDVLTWLLAYANDKLRPESSLRNGALITTGSLCGAIELAEPGEIDIVLAGTDRLQLTLT